MGNLGTQHGRTAAQSFFSRSHFVDHLRMEKRRVERSKAPLSIALFFLGQNNGKDLKSVQEFLGYLRKSSREIDIRGWFAEDVIGVLLPNTGSVGANIYVKKILEGKGQAQFSVITGTYPDHLFDRLLVKAESEPDLYPFDLDEHQKPRYFQLALKRWIDVMGSLLGLIILSPLMLIISLAVKANSPGPVIFKQSRLGIRGLRFPFYKFRSMYWNCDDQIHRQYVTDLIKGRLESINQGDGENPFFKMKSDPRLTRVGKILRYLSLDELPQLFNVLKGEMSLVGPRPPIPYEVEKYEPWHLRRILDMKPGITGLWQVSGRSTTSFDEMVRLDLRYVRNWSLWLDLKILLRTVKEVLHPHGAA